MFVTLGVIAWLKSYKIAVKVYKERIHTWKISKLWSVYSIVMAVPFSTFILFYFFFCCGMYVCDSFSCTRVAFYENMDAVNGTRFPKEIKALNNNN